MAQEKKKLRKTKVKEETIEQEEKIIKKEQPLEEKVNTSKAPEFQFNRTQIKANPPIQQQISAQDLEDIAAPVIVPKKRVEEKKGDYIKESAEYGGTPTGYEQAKKDDPYQAMQEDDWMEHEEFNKKKKKSPFEP